MTAKAFREVLNDIGTPRIRLNINSPGGDVFDGIAIFSDLLDHDATVDVRVTGLAASIASIIAMAGDTVTIADHAFFMIHNAWSVAVGDKRAMTDRAKVLAKIDGELAATYASATGQDVDDLTEMMNAETWLTAAEAVDLGFADEVISDDEDEEETANASFDLSIFKNAPRAFKRSKPSPKAKSTGDDGKKPVVPANQSFSALVEALNGVKTALAS